MNFGRREIVLEIIIFHFKLVKEFINNIFSVPPAMYHIIFSSFYFFMVYLTTIQQSRLDNTEPHTHTPWFLVRKRTIPIERSPPVSEASANFSGRGCRVVSATNPSDRNFDFLDLIPNHRMINRNNNVKSNCDLLWGRHYLPGVFLEGWRQNMKTPTEDNWSLVGDLNHGHTETIQKR
jgi:hypothetical protein